METPFLSLEAIQVNQPFGPFYICKISAENLLKVAFTDPLRYDGNEIKGSQRVLDEQKRVKEIKEFVEGTEAAFPNAIILSANYDEKGLNEIDEEFRWTYEDGILVVPTQKKLASIVDGQHRLFCFQNASAEAQKMDLVCSVYLDLPNSYQAYIFATINSNQKPVNKSLAYEQFGFNVDKEDPVSFSPDKLAIAIYRRLNEDSDSPFYRHIKIAPQIDEILKQQLKEAKWLISTATIVDGVIRLISTNPKLDKYTLQKLPLSERRRSVLANDNSPLRKLYIEYQDIVLVKIISNFFSAAVEVLFKPAKDDSSIFKTFGIQGLFDVLREVSRQDIVKYENLSQVDFRYNRFIDFFNNVKFVDFSNQYFQYSGVGRAAVANVILLATGYLNKPNITDDMSENQLQRAKRKIDQINQLQTIIDQKG